MVTLKDIADMAGVSVATVSYVINGRFDKVSVKTIQRIQRIIQETKYSPSMSARTLANKSSNIIGIINHTVSEKAGSFLIDPFHSSFIAGMERTIREAGYFMMLRTVKDAAALDALIANWNLDGMILTGLFRDDFYQMLREKSTPFVLIDSYIDDPDICNVGLEDCRGAYLATKLLLEKGHRRIAFACPPIRKAGVVEERLLGYQRALCEYGVSYDPDYVFVQEISVEEGLALGERLAGRPEITAVFASADILAAGIMAGLKNKGVEVPRDKSVVGFDDVYFSLLTSPTLTTIHQDAAKKGMLAAQLLIATLEHRPIPQKQIVLPVSLVERESVRAI
ncbi:MAG: LacI family DNA-binding transcriptional regulator [Sphaerochaetaceae bacterium]|nr:LacI family DNA-binding transcriptional regulator [Sphaerochaetaceae bacterium]